MFYSVAEEEKLMGIIESIAEQPLEERNFNVIRNPKPVCESLAGFGDKDWAYHPADDSKVGCVKPVEAKKTAQVTEVKAAETEKKDSQVVEVDARPEVKVEDAPEPKKNFDQAAKSAVSSKQGEADSNKKFMENAKKQKNLDIFKKYCDKIAEIDPSSKDAVNAVFAKVAGNIDFLKAK